MTLPVIMNFIFFRIFFLLYCLVSEIGHLTSDFELIGGVVMAETSYLLLSELRSLFTRPQLNLLIFLLFIIMFG